MGLNVLVCADHGDVWHRLVRSAGGDAVHGWRSARADR